MVVQQMMRSAGEDDGQWWAGQVGAVDVDTDRRVHAVPIHLPPCAAYHSHHSHPRPRQTHYQLPLRCSALSLLLHGVWKGIKLSCSSLVNMSTTSSSSTSTDSQHSSYWPTPARHHYNAPYLPTSILSSPPTPSTVTAFDSADAPLLSLHLPKLWADPAPSFSSSVHTDAQLAWNEDGLHCLFRIRGPFKLATDDPHVKESRMHDSRVELFVCPSAARNVYHAFELNSAGRALDFKAELTSPTSAQLDFSHSFSVKGQHTPTSQLPPSYEYDHLYLMTVPWSDVLVEGTGGDESAFMDSLNARDMRVAVLRGEVVVAAGKDGEAEVQYPHTHCWSTAIDPESPDVTFHTTKVFMAFQLRKAP